MNKAGLLLIPVALFAIALYFGAGAVSSEAERFTEARFVALQEEGAVILVDIHATWCVTCRRQREVIRRYREAHPDVDFVFLSVDFDSDKATVRALRAPGQSTLLLYRGDERVWFSVGETRQEVIFAALNAVATGG